MGQTPKEAYVASFRICYCGEILYSLAILLYDQENLFIEANHINSKAVCLLN